MTIRFATILAKEYNTSDSYKRVKTEYLEGYRSEFDQTEVLEQASFLRKKFNLDIVDDVYKYLEKIKIKRSEIILTYSTEFGRLGVRPFKDEIITRFKGQSTVEYISDFLKSSNKSSRLQFYRDCASRFSITGERKRGVRKIIKECLLEDGYIDIANNLKMY